MTNVRDPYAAPRRGIDRALLALTVVSLCALYAPTVTWLFDRWTMSVWHNIHGLMIPPIAAYVLWRRLRARRGVAARPSAWGFLLIVPALLLHAVDAGLQTELLSAVSLLMVLPGLALLLLGAGATRAIAFPLAFSLFMLPIPLVVTERLNFVLRNVAALGAGHLVQALGIPAHVDGTLLELPSSTLFVSDGCSGFATLYASAAIACLAAYVTESRWRRAAVIAAVVPLAIGANILRVTMLALLVWRQGDDVLATSLHPLSGVLAFVLALVVLLRLSQPQRRPPLAEV